MPKSKLQHYQNINKIRHLNTLADTKNHSKKTPLNAKQGPKNGP
ncbi:MAG: hypothetical protein [Arizlama microvirus]|nr:MAG: hypothetical protein [Arizlama microvirus]